MSETMKLLESPKSKITKNGENVPRLEITEVVLAHGNIVSNKFIPHKSPKEKHLPPEKNYWWWNNNIIVQQWNTKK